MRTLTNRLIALSLALAVCTAAMGLDAREAFAGHAERWQHYQKAVQKATTSTTAAGTNWNAWPTRRAAFLEAMRTHNASSRVLVKKAEVRWLRNAQRLLNIAAADHHEALRALDSFTYFAGSTKALVAERAALRAAQIAIRDHVKAISELILWVGRMR